MGKYDNVDRLHLPSKFGANEESSGGIDLSPSKMALINVDKLDDQLIFHYNPTSWSDTRSTEWSSDDDVPQFSKTGKRVITMTLFFDDSTIRANLFARSGGYRSPSFFTHGQFAARAIDKFGNTRRKQAKGGFHREAPALNPGKRIGEHGQMPTQGSIYWLRNHSMKIPGRWEDSPPVLIFSGLREHHTYKLFSCILTQVDVTPLSMKSKNPWLVNRANISITLEEFLESKT